MDAGTEALLAAAVRAPSGDNTQPWRWVVGPGWVGLTVDPARDPSPMNAGQRMARLAAGAALETLLRAAASVGAAADLDPDPGPYLARVRLADTASAAARPVDPRIGARATNRRPYDGRPAPADVLARLAAETPEAGGVVTHWVTGPDRLAALGRVIGRADALMFGEPAMRRAFLDNVRFDRPAAEGVDEGLSLASLEPTAADRLGLRVMRRCPDLLLRLGGIGSVFAAKARGLVAGASGLCVVSAPDPDCSEAADLAVGRALQRAWLALTGEGLAAQPMMSVPVLANALEHGGDPLRSALGPGRVAALLDEFRSLVPECTGRPAWVMRFGYAPPPTGRTGRLPLDRVTSFEPS